MAIRIKIIWALTGILSFSIFFNACKQNNASKKIKLEEQQTADKAILTLDTFSVLPPEIDGCSCYFSNDSTEFGKDKYIYVNDYAQVSFLKINGVLTKFIQTDFKKIDSITTISKSKAKNYEMVIEVKDGIISGDETQLQTGMIKVTDKSGNTITKKFYGECGC